MSTGVSASAHNRTARTASSTWIRLTQPSGCDADRLTTEARRPVRPDVRDHRCPKAAGCSPLAAREGRAGDMFGVEADASASVVGRQGDASSTHSPSRLAINAGAGNVDEPSAVGRERVEHVLQSVDINVAFGERRRSIEADRVQHGIDARQARRASRCMTSPTMGGFRPARTRPHDRSIASAPRPHRHDHAMRGRPAGRDSRSRRRDVSRENLLAGLVSGGREG